MNRAEFDFYLQGYMFAVYHANGGFRFPVL